MFKLIIDGTQWWTDQDVSLPDGKWAPLDITYIVTWTPGYHGVTVCVRERGKHTTMGLATFTSAS